MCEIFEFNGDSEEVDLIVKQFEKMNYRIIKILKNCDGCADNVLIMEGIS
jgi:hypothetical protein